MKWRKWFEDWGMTGVKINLQFLEMEFAPKDEDKDAAWELYVEMVTRVAIQVLPDQQGDEKTALDSLYKIFGITREILKKHGKFCTEFAKIAVIVLNQVLRPFTAKWHKESLKGAFEDDSKCQEFRGELKEVQTKLRIYTNMLGEMAGLKKTEVITLLDVGEWYEITEENIKLLRTKLPEHKLETLKLLINDDYLKEQFNKKLEKLGFAPEEISTVIEKAKVEQVKLK